MKKLLIISISSVLFIGCGAKESKPEENSNSDEKLETNIEKTEISANTKNEEISVVTNVIDDALSDYEAYVKEYLEIVSNIKNGNADEWDRYNEFSTKGDEIGIILQDLENEFSEEQAKRITELNQMITDAAMSLVPEY